MRAKNIRFQGQIEGRAEIKSLLFRAGDTVIINRGRPRSTVMLCPCGCGDELTINLDSRIGPAWKIYIEKESLSIYPSIWRENNCQSHFIIWKNKIYWCDYESLWDEVTINAALEDRILKILSGRELTHYQYVAELMDEIPWSTLICCRRLVKKGILKEGANKYKGFFQYS